MQRPDYAAIAAQSSSLNADEHLRLVDPMLAFYESLNELRDDQKTHLVTLYELSDVLHRVARKEPYRDTLNLIRRRLLDLSEGRNAAEMKREAEAIANLIRTRLDTPEEKA